MRPHVVFVKELNQRFPILAANVFDAAIFALGEHSPGWIRAVCTVKLLGEDELYDFRLTSFGDRVEFDLGE